VRGSQITEEEAEFAFGAALKETDGGGPLGAVAGKRDDRSRAVLGMLDRHPVFGQTHGHLIGHDASGIRRAKEVGLASAKAAYCFGMALVTAVSPIRRNRSVLRGIMHVGVVSGLVGVREIRQYGLSSPQQGGKRAA